MLFKMEHVAIISCQWLFNQLFNIFYSDHVFKHWVDRSTDKLKNFLQIGSQHVWIHALMPLQPMLNQSVEIPSIIRTRLLQTGWECFKNKFNFHWEHCYPELRSEKHTSIQSSLANKIRTQAVLYGVYQNFFFSLSDTWNVYCCYFALPGCLNISWNISWKHCLSLPFPQLWDKMPGPRSGWEDGPQSHGCVACMINSPALHALL